jgi:pimeloyl-ACP methyl ester carboxylesterase
LRSSSQAPRGLTLVIYERSRSAGTADRHAVIRTVGATLLGVQLQRIEVDGASVSYRVAGAGFPIVLVHGLAGSWRWWSQVWKSLAAQRSVFLVDLPRLGSRQSAQELSAWLGRWLDAVALDRVDVVGHSLGGLVAAELAAHRRERVRRLALVAPAGIPSGLGLLRSSLRLVETLYEVRARLPTVVIDAARTSPLALLRGAAFASGRDLRTELASVRAPTLLVWGEHDRLTPTAVAEEWHRALPGSQLVLLPCGHVPMWEAPDRLSACLLTFLEKQPFDNASDEIRPRVVHSVRLARDDDQSTSRE